jgi:molecular chaperone HtpG
MAKAQKKSDTQTQHTAETLAFSAEISKVLRLMIHSLYTNKDIFLRELISNASDACDKLRYQSLTNQALLADAAELRITISHDEKANTIDVSDTGIGMNREELIAHLGTIAKSGTEEFLSAIANSKDQTTLIGQFGVGFYSSFMVADTVEVISRKAGETEAWKWESSGDGTFTITPIEGDAPRGTTVRLYVRDDAKEYLDTFKLRNIIETYSDHISFPIYQCPVTFEGEQGEPELVNEGGALWVKPKAEITPEQYKDFYHHVAHSPDEPWLTMHNSVEGKTSYTNLLFIPSMKPFDLFHPERRRRVKLYVKRVFITEENVDLVPHYLRFLRGIIDSNDLPLNISRETLQDDPRLKSIRESITSKVLSELKKKAEKDADNYRKFWDNFGAVVKEGLCEFDSPREKLLEVCRFTSTADESVSLAEYLKRKPEAQQHIFYLTADSLEAARHSPLLDGFTKRGIEVLLLTDHVDDFWVNVVGSYQDVALKSITRSDIDLEAIAPLVDKSEEGKDKADAKVQDISLDAQTQLLARLRGCYGEGIRDVRTTDKLTDALACLAVAEGAMEMRMERFLKEHNQLPRRGARILEVNMRHPFFRYLVNIMNDTSKGAEFEECASLLLDQACIIEGETIDNPAAFAKRLGSLMQRAFG